MSAKFNSELEEYCLKSLAKYLKISYASYLFKITNNIFTFTYLKESMFNNSLILSESGIKQCIKIIEEDFILSKILIIINKDKFIFKIKSLRLLGGYFRIKGI